MTSRRPDGADALPGEDALIARYFRPLATSPGAFALEDDAACIEPRPHHALVITSDAIVEGVHFLADDPPRSVARKALRVNLSDLAAKGAAPIGFTLTLALPAANGEWLAAFADALGDDAHRYGCPLLGGDTVKTPGPLVISITAFGEVPSGTMVRRGAGRAGDIVMVTGTIGDAALGLKLLQGAHWTLTEDQRAHLVGRYREPQPRNALAEIVRTHARAAMDMSDGLIGDLARMCRVSHVGATIGAESVPLSGAAQAVVAQDAQARELILAGGDDYELLCALAPEAVADFEREVQAAGVPVARIGKFEEGEGVRVLDASGADIAVAAAPYSHF